jgi:hypothetical protein
VCRWQRKYEKKIVHVYWHSEVERDNDGEDEKEKVSNDG